MLVVVVVERLRQGLWLVLASVVVEWLRLVLWLALALGRESGVVPAYLLVWAREEEAVLA